MQTLPKTETEVLEPHLDFARMLETVWRAGRAHSLGDYVRPSAPNGFEYECTSGGQTAADEPEWPLTVAGTVTDGTVVWTARAFSTNATDTIQSINVIAPTGITVATPTFAGTEVYFTVSGGTKLRRYTISVEVTTVAGEVLEEKLVVTVRSA